MAVYPHECSPHHQSKSGFGAHEIPPRKRGLGFWGLVLLKVPIEGENTKNAYNGSRNPTKTCTGFLEPRKPQSQMWFGFGVLNWLATNLARPSNIHRYRGRILNRGFLKQYRIGNLIGLNSNGCRPHRNLKSILHIQLLKNIFFK